MPPPTPPYCTSLSEPPTSDRDSCLSRSLSLRRKALTKSLPLHQPPNSDASGKLATIPPLTNNNVVPKIRVDLPSPEESAANRMNSTSQLPPLAVQHNSQKPIVPAKAMPLPLHKFKGVHPAASDTPEPSAPTSPRM
jgi:hypothetical protein